MRSAEEQGFRYGWTFDSRVLWQEPFVIYTHILAATSELMVGPMVTNPRTRDWSVTASLFATLNDMFGNRTVCGIGRGDSALRVIGQRPVNLATMAEAMHVIKGLAQGREVMLHGAPIRIPWVRDGRLEMWMAALRAQGAGPGRCAGGRVHPADRRPGHRPVDGRHRPGGGAGGLLGPGRHHRVRGRARLCRHGRGAPRDQLRWFGGMVGNDVAEPGRPVRRGRAGAP